MTRRGWVGRTTVLVAVGLFVSMPVRLSADPVVRVEVQPRVLVADLPRIGVNLGAGHSWGAEQLSANVLQNPGFEGLISRQLVFVHDSGENRFRGSERGSWLLWPDGFWNGATFDVRSGPSAGRQGLVAEYRAAGEDGLPQYVSRELLPPLRAGDVVALTREWNPEKPGRWVGDGVVEEGVTRPGSPGRCSVRLDGKPKHPVEISYYLDSIGSRAGKLLPVDGRWRLAFWSRADGGPADLSIRFRRLASDPFVDQTLPVGPDWRLTELEFEAVDSGLPKNLELRFETSGPGRVYLDDVELGPRVEAVGGFRPEVVEVLRSLRPGYVRDWQGQQASTLANSLAGPFARRLTVSGPRAEVATFEYSLPEFFALCRQVGAAPWIVVPTAVSDEELAELGRFLAENASAKQFAEVVVEIGNENWNPLSQPVGLTDPSTHGEVVERAFAIVRKAAGRRVPLRTAINGQFVNPDAVAAFARSAPHADLVGVAPYFLYSLDAGLSPDRWVEGMFPDASSMFDALRSRLPDPRQELAVYEVNLHTTGGNAPAAERDQVTAGAASGSAVARRILQAQAAGARRQCAYTLAGYDMFTNDGASFVKLWGLVRDLTTASHLRPSGLAVAMLNRALGGDRHEIRSVPASADLEIAAYRSRSSWSLAVVSARQAPTRFEVTFPAGRLPLPTRLLTLSADSPWDTNEQVENVRIVETQVHTKGRRIWFEVPALGLVVVAPPAAAL